MMGPLEKALRNDLERTVKEARDVAEAAAKTALDQLGVGEASPFAHLVDEKRDLRRKLRIHGHQLGDRRDSKSSNPSVGKQAIDRLIEEVAYEHWHRMLFARFLAENNLLMYEDVAISLEECEELAVDEGMSNGWQLAARLASKMLPQIFRPDSPVFQLIFPPERQQRLERLVAQLPQEVFAASDSLGWVYQFWRAKQKDEVNASEVKIGARELPAVTQLFTEPYMVAFLLDNSLGAWWAMRRLDEDDLRNAESEDELRTKAALPGVPLEYLRFVRSEDGAWRPAAGTFEKWPDELGKLTTLDPCCGSGHFLVAAFLMLVPLRMELKKLSAREAVDAVLRENLHGLELDRRCIELAAFALALTAWRYPEAGGYRPLPELHLACSGLSVGAAKEEWKQLALGKKNLRLALEWMHDVFRDAPVLGSLLNPARTDAARIIQWEELSQALSQALAGEQTDEQREAGVVAQGLSKAATLLAGQYQWVITNVPYRSRGTHGDTLRQFCEQYCPAGKSDLATVFLSRCLEFCRPGGTTSLVLPQNWLFLSSYRKLREQLLQHETWHLIARLGAGAFETISGEVVKAILITLSRGSEEGVGAGKTGGLFAGDGSAVRLSGMDVSLSSTAIEKAVQLRIAEIKQVSQAKQLENPDAIIKFENAASISFVRDYASSYQGLTTGDDPRLKRHFWEVQPELCNSTLWKRLQGPSQGNGLFSGRENIVDARLITGQLRIGALRGREAWNNKGVAIDRVASLSVALYNGDYYHSLIPVLIPKDSAYLPAILAFALSDELRNSARNTNQALSIDNGYFEKFEIDLDRWAEIARENYPNGLPNPYSDDPAQWVFHGHPCGSVIFNETSRRLEHGPLRTDETVLQVAVARLLGYRWPAETDAEMELSDESREWIERAAALNGYADEDGILCLPAVRGEASAADRLLSLLAAAYGERWSTQTLNALLKAADHEGKTLETWLRDKFFAAHCRIFQNRPFIWHIWDGLRDGFAAMVNYHKLDRQTLETLIYTYLGDWMTRQKQDKANSVDGAEEKLAAAEGLKKRLELILVGESPYDIFVRWKPIEQQPIGWDPDLNDGVRLNIRPFLSVPDVGKKGTGVLRDKPNIKWEKDRGKDVESAPWYKVFKGDRINDHHLTLAEKRAARMAMEKGAAR